jgi:Cdk activating kinase (CAK)/RNA polymerase II transcription initiation/nucleotide excision repair factor TFIIH, subunit TFB3
MRKVRAGMQAVRVRPTKLCERCCLLIHQRGQAGAPYPRAARWRVTWTDGVVERLCDSHKDERCHR